MRAAAALLVALFGFVAAADLSAQRARPTGIRWDTLSYQPLPSRYGTDLKTRPWNSGVGTSGTQTIDCATARANTLSSLDQDEYYFATALQGDLGEYFQRHFVLISDSIRESDIMGTIVHEAQHHAGIANEARADAAINCFPGATEEEEDENDGDGDNDGGSGGSGGGGRPVPRIIPHHSTPGLWIVIIPPPDPEVTIGDVQVVCDYDPDTAWPDCNEVMEEANN